MNLLIVKWAVIFTLFASLIMAAYYKGKRVVYEEWHTRQLEVDKQIAELEAQSSQLTTKVITHYVDRVKVVKEKNDEIVKHVNTISPEVDNKCIVTNNVVGMLNSAVQNTIPNSTTITDEGTSPFKISHITRNTIENYGICHEYKEQIIALQNWINEQHAIK